MIEVNEEQVAVVSREDQRARQTVKANATRLSELVIQVTEDCAEFGPVRASQVAGKTGVALSNAIVAAHRIKDPDMGPKARAYTKEMIAQARHAWDVIELAMTEKEEATE